MSDFVTRDTAAFLDRVKSPEDPALALEGFVPPYEATLTRHLREAGAIIIAKTGLTELANWVAGAPTPMPGCQCCSTGPTASGQNQRLMIAP